MSLGPIMMDIEGLELSAQDKALLRHPLVGGLIYFARNFESHEQIRNLSAQIRQERPDILIAVDQEGGRVQRFKAGFTRLPAMQCFLPLFHQDPAATLELLKDTGWLMAVELLAVGVDFSFAPVLDVDDHRCEVIADRSFSPSPQEVTLLAGSLIEGMNEAGMAATGKHFPGHGGVLGDSHQLLPVDERSFDEIDAHDLIPFQTLSRQLSAVMPAHIVFSQVDENPVGFSNYWLDKVLRRRLGFEGVIFSDDLSMEGAAFAGGYVERVKAALGAGCDMALVCNHRDGVNQVIEALSHEQYTVCETSRTRLASLSAGQSWNTQDFTELERYQRTQARLQALVEKG